MSTKKTIPQRKKLSNAEVKEQLNLLLESIKEHQSNMTGALEAISQSIKVDAAVVHVEIMRKALQSFTSGRKSVEIAKRMLKERVLERIKD